MNSTTRAHNGSGRGSTELAARLRTAITAGRFGPGRYLPTERKLAAKHGVAPMTARRALKVLEAEGLVAAEPRQGYRVLATANDPDRGAPIAYILSPHPGPELWDELHKEYVSCFQRAADAQGWSLLAVGAEERTNAEVVEQLRTARVCAAILDTPSRELMAEIQRAGLPALAVDDWREDLDIDAVVQDGFRGGLLAGAWLAERGHKKIGWLGPIGVSRQGLERFGGASAALAARGIDIPRKLRIELKSPEAPEAIELARKMLSRSDRPTAVLALWQGCTASLVAAARELGLVPGKDFDMVGWSTESGYKSSFLPQFNGGPVPPAAVWSVETLGRTAVARLAARRANPDLPAIKLKVSARLRFAEEKEA